MIKSKTITIDFMTEKNKGHGEDAPALLVVNNKICAVGVFDGMGGAGAATCNSDFGENHTKAYVASRITQKAVKDFLNDNFEKEAISSDSLKSTISERLRNETEKFPSCEKSMLRSKLVRDYPTTMALITLHDIGESFEIDSYWAGDSRCYLWTNEGFYQISKDDLENDIDPMENLSNDSPMTNCICADREFIIHHKPILLKKVPVIILCATDGCFGYYKTPMHFENMLKRCLQEAKDKDDWKNLIKNEILKVTGDDCSISLIAEGCTSFEDLKETMTTNTTKGFHELQEQEEKIASFTKFLTTEKDMYEKNAKNAWKEYKNNYMKYINSEDNANA